MGRRANGEGSIRQRKEGRWEASIQNGYKDNGKPRIVYFYGRTRKDVQKKLAEFIAARSSGLAMDRKYTFGEFADIWFEHHKANITPTTQEHYKYTLRILKEHFKDRPLSEIKAFDIELFLRKIQNDGRSKSAIAQCRGMLFQIFNKAEANDLLNKNPVRFADKMRSREPAKRKDAFTSDEVRLLMEKLPHDRIGYTIRLMLGTGMRTQEVLALEPKHIAEDGSVIRICQAVNMVKGTVTVGPPKSRDSYRDVPVPPSLRHCARFLRETNNKYVWEVGKKDSPCNPSYFRDRFKVEVEKVEGVRVLTPHSCRHTYVSQMQALGVDLQTIQSIVGHADIDMTQHYLHVQDSIRQQAVNLFSEAFATTQDEVTCDTAAQIT